jgi:cytochrome c oxidase cbb3-type subunit 1
MINPLAHTHINVVGGVVLLCMAVTYYLLPRLSGVPLYSQRMITHTFLAGHIRHMWLLQYAKGVWDYRRYSDPAK